MELLLGLITSAEVHLALFFGIPIALIGIVLLVWVEKEFGIQPKKRRK